MSCAIEPPPQVREALHMAVLTLDIDNLPRGLESVIGSLDADVHLSFGQKQRVALARTLFRNTPIVLLDEPSSAQEPATVAEIGRNLLNLRYHCEADGRHKPCTVLAVTHNMDMLKVNPSPGVWKGRSGASRPKAEIGS